MIAILIALACHATLVALLVLVAPQPFDAFVGWLAYWMFGTWALVRYDCSWPWLRATRLSDTLRRSLCALRLDSVSHARLAALAPDLRGRRQAIFAVEPHGYACIAVALLFAGYGTAGSPRDALGADIAGRIRVVGHWIALTIPFVRELYAVFGVLNCSRASFEQALRSRQHLAVIPSGVNGKRDAVLRAPRAGVVDVLRRPDDRLGFLSLATRFGALIVPVLALDEQSTYTALGPRWLPWPLQLVVGRCLVAPLARSAPMRVAVGEPIDTAALNRHRPGAIEELAERYYDALSRLADEHGVRLELHRLSDGAPHAHFE